MQTRIQQILDRIEGRGKKDSDKEDHSLRKQAMDRAHHLERPHAGTPHDWEDWEAYTKSPVPSKKER